MSLINDMLRNLETRRPDDPARQNLQREIRALPGAASRRRPLRIALWTLLPVLGVAAAVYYLDGRPLPAVTASVPPPPVPAPAQPVSVAEPAVAAPPAAPEPLADELRLSPALSALPTTAPAVLPVPDPLPAAIPPAAAVAAAPAGPVRIEKSPVAASPRDRADAEFRRAEAAMQAGRQAEAVDGLRTALRYDAGYVPPRQLLLRLLLEQRRFDEAVAVLQEGLDGQPQQSGWAMSLARLQQERGDVAAAEATLTRSQPYAEGRADYAGFQGYLAARLGTPKPAVAHYQRATRLAPGEGRWWLGLGLALEADGHGGEGREAFRRALATGSLSGELAGVAEQHLR